MLKESPSKYHDAWHTLVGAKYVFNKTVITTIRKVWRYQKDNEKDIQYNGQKIKEKKT
jgi:hypothetical protein